MVKPFSLTRDFTSKAIAVSLLALSISVVPGCKNGTFSNHYSTKQEIGLGEQENDQIIHSEKIDYDPATNLRVQNIAGPIFAQAKLMRSDVTYKITVIDNPEVNAFSIPGGWVYIYTGLLNKVGKDNDALACVIGHETAHVVCRHVVKQMSDEDVKGVLVNVLGLATRNYNLYNAASAAYEYDELHYSREDEYEADKYGLMFAYDSGYDPYGMIRFFRKLEVVDKGAGGQPEWTEDHPLTRNRIDRAVALIELLRNNDGHYPVDVDKSTAASAIVLDEAPLATIPTNSTPVTAVPPTGSN